jgi:hypothetical protein
MSEVVQIIPADGWGARYRSEDGEDVVPLVCWGLIETEYGRSIVGFSAADGSVEETNESNFVGYVPPGEM